MSTVLIQHRRGTSTEWSSGNPILAAGEIGYETDTGKTKIGNGASQWASLPYSSTDISTLATRVSLGNAVDISATKTSLGAAITALTDLANLRATQVSLGNVQSQLTNIIGDAPAAIDTIHELADALKDNADVLDLYATQVSLGNYATQVSLGNYATQVSLGNTNALVALNATQVSLGNTDALVALKATQVSLGNTDAAVALKADKAGETFTGNIAVAKSFPDVELKAGNEKRLLFSDAGGGSTGAIKHVSSSLDFYAGGIAGGDKKFEVDSAGVVVTGRANVSGDLDLGGTLSVDNDAVQISPGTGDIDMTGDLYVGGDIVKMSNLPTSDPAVLGRLWNDSGTLKISAG